MEMNTSSHIADYIIIFGALSLPLIFLWQKFFPKKERPPLKVVNGSPDINRDILEAAEKLVATVNLREEFYKTYRPLRFFYSSQGHDFESMSKLVQKLRDSGIPADFIFSPATPGVALNHYGNTGDFELFVDKDMIKEAEDFLANLKN